MKLRGYFAIVGLLLVVGGVVYYLFGDNRARVEQVHKLDNETWYKALITSTRWQDTGVWVASGQAVTVAGFSESSKQPFEFRLKDDVFQAFITRENVFAAAARLDGKGQQKLYIRLTSEATEPANLLIVVVRNE
jgi:lipopolysaccharide export system protein LptC